MKKSLKFRDFLVPLILSGEKFAEAIITFVRQKALGDLEESDYEGHERFKSDEAMYKAYQKYYKDEEVGPETLVKIISFQLK